MNMEQFPELSWLQSFLFQSMAIRLTLNDLPQDLLTSSPVLNGQYS